MTSISDTEVVNAPGGLVELGYLEYTGSNVQLTGSANTYIGGTLTCICDGSPIIIEVYCPRVDMAANSDSWLAIEIDGVSQGRVLAAYNPNSGASPAPTFAQIRATPTAGTRTFRMRAYSSSGTTTWLNGAGVFPNTYIRVSKVLQASQLLVTQSNAPIVTSLPSGNLVTGQEVYLYTIYGYVRYLWDGSNWIITADNRKVFFTARGTSYQGAANGFYNFIFNTTDQNIGNAYNTANGAFTAPISGLYFFGLNVRLDSTPAGGYLRAYVYRNGTTTWEAPNLHAIFGNNHATDYHTLSVSGLMYLTEGQVVYSGGGHISGSSNLLRSESTFTGYLVK